MKKIIIFFIVSLFSIGIVAQESGKKKPTTYKKKVLDNVEINFLYSYYQQNGDHASVTGGKGDEFLTDQTPTIVLNIPLNSDDVLSINYGIDILTAASTDKIFPFSANVNPSDDYTTIKPKVDAVTRPSRSGGVLSGNSGNAYHRKHGTSTYSHASDNRNFSWNVNSSFSTELGYKSFGIGGGFNKLFNDKNSEISFNLKSYFDKINIAYPSEFVPGSGFTPSINFKLLDKSYRDSYTVSLSYSQLISSKLQISFLLDVIHQEGLLSTNYHRVYFADRTSIFKEGFELGDDIERLPNVRTKIPLGVRLNYYLNDYIIVKSFYRYYYDNWGINSHTFDLQLPIKITPSLTTYPMFRVYTQTKADYFAPYRIHLSTEKYYTSDYDLSNFDSYQYGLGINFAPALGLVRMKISKKKSILRFKSFDISFNYYDRSDGLTAYILSVGTFFTY